MMNCPIDLTLTPLFFTWYPITITIHFSVGMLGQCCRKKVSSSHVSTHRTTDKALSWNRRGYAPPAWIIRHQWRGFNRKGNLMKSSANNAFCHHIENAHYFWVYQIYSPVVPDTVEQPLCPTIAKHPLPMPLWWSISTLYSPVCT